MEAVQDDRESHPWYLDRLLDDVALGRRHLDGRLPLRLVDRPAQDDPFSAVLVVRLEHEVVATACDLLSQLVADAARPWNVPADGRALGRRVQTGVAIIREEGQAHL